MTEQTGIVQQESPTRKMVAQLKTVKNIIAENATDQELVLFAQYCVKKNLDPFAKQIFFIKRGKGDNAKASFQTSIDGYRAIADRTGLYAGNDDYLFNDGKTQFEMLNAGVKKPITATATVYKLIQGNRIAFSATVDFDSYVQSFWDSRTGKQTVTPTWEKMAFTMLGKCAESLAFRKAFPAELGGLYTQEEMGQVDQQSETPAPKGYGQVVHTLPPNNSAPITQEDLTAKAPQPKEHFTADGRLVHEGEIAQDFAQRNQIEPATEQELEDLKDIFDAPSKAEEYVDEAVESVNNFDAMQDKRKGILFSVMKTLNLTIEQVETQFNLKIAELSGDDTNKLIGELTNMIGTKK